MKWELDNPTLYNSRFILTWNLNCYKFTFQVCVDRCIDTSSVLRSKSISVVCVRWWSWNKEESILEDLWQKQRKVFGESLIFFFFKKKGFVLFCAVTAWIFFPDLSNSVIQSHCILAKRPRSDSTINHKRSLSQHHGSVISVCQRIRQSGRGYERRHRGWCFDTVGTQEALRRAVCYRIEKVIC